MMAVTVERALAFPLRDSWVPCRDGGAKLKEEKRPRGLQPASPSVRPLAPRAAIAVRWTQPWTELRRCLQPSHSKTGIANGQQQSQVISQHIFPALIALRGRCRRAKAESRGATALPDRGTGGQSQNVKMPANHPSGKEGAAVGHARAAWRGPSCASYQICRNRCGDEGVGPVNQSAADDQHRYEEGDGRGGTQEEMKSLSPSSLAPVRPSPSRASVAGTSPFSPRDPTQQAANADPAPPSPKSRAGSPAQEEK